MLLSDRFGSLERSYGATTTAHHGVLSRFDWYPADARVTQISCEVDGRSFMFSNVPLPVPRWFRATAEDVCRVLNLANNWDSYGAPRIDRTLAGTGLGLLLEVMDPDTPAPTVVPTAEGGIQFEWHSGGMDVEIELPPDGAVRFFLGHVDAPDRDVDGDISILHEVVPSALRQLSAK